jgi:hypothetical protein
LPWRGSTTSLCNTITRCIYAHLGFISKKCKKDLHLLYLFVTFQQMGAPKV